MWKLKNKKGFSLIEVMCSITIFYICFIAITIMEINNIKLHKENTIINEYINYVDTLKNVIKSNYTYEEIISLKNKYYYISKENLGVDILLNNEVINILKEEKPIEEPYIQLEFEETEILNINIDLYYKKNKKQVKIHADVYKSRYQ